MAGWSAGGVALLRVIVGSVHKALVVGDCGLEGFRCSAVECASVGQDPGWGGRPGVGFSRGGGRLEGVTGEGREAHTCAHLSAHPCLALPMSVPVGSCTMITCQGCDPGTMVGGVVFLWACNHYTVSAFAVT